jgi:hypothetical protein
MAAASDDNTSNSTQINVSRPDIVEPIRPLQLFERGTSIKDTIATLEAGKQVLIVGFYNNGLALLKDIHNHLARKFNNKTFLEQREYRTEFRKLSNLILVEIKNHKITVDKSPEIGWIKKLYPNTPDFLLAFPQIQGLNSSWQWYKKGISIPVLRNKLHPYYGTYFPTRFEHLQVFDNWLKRYEGPRKSAIEVGVGSGVLSFQMVQDGFQKVFATDTNPNAIVGLKEFMGTTKLSRKIELDFAHLFGKWEKQSELIIFNPPWLPQSHELGRIDEAIYYTDKLFPEFFNEAKKRLLPEGKLLLVFSNLAQITEVTNSHPIEHELAEGGRFKLEKCYRKSVKAASDKTKRDQNWRSEEEVELWVLTH